MMKIENLKLFEKRTKWHEKYFENLEFWKLFEIWNFENYSKIIVLKITWKFEFFLKKKFKIGILKIIWKLKFEKLNLKIGVLKIRVLKITWKLEF